MIVHELSLCQAIVDTVDQHTNSRGVRRVNVRIGHFRQVVPDSLLFSWDRLTEHSALAGAELVIEHVPAVIECHDCGAHTTLDVPILLCGDCDRADVVLVSGEEFLIASIDRRKEAS